MACCRIHHSFDEYGCCIIDDYCEDDGDDDRCNGYYCKYDLIQSEIL